MLVLSDIHANRPALDAVLADAGSHDAVLCCGDLAGYYPWPDAVVERMQEEDARCVRGNHDEALVTASTFGFGGDAGAALRWTDEQVADGTRRFLEDLPYSRRETVRGQDVYMVHGSPRQPVEEYVYPDTVDEGFLERQGVAPDILLLGHTHVPFVDEVGGTLVVNPGSVGQPRDGDPRASYAVLDLAEPSATIHRVDYPVDEVQDAVRDAGLPDGLADRLARGR